MTTFWLHAILQNIYGFPVADASPSSSSFVAALATSDSNSIEQTQRKLEIYPENIARTTARSVREKEEHNVSHTCGRVRVSYKWHSPHRTYTHHSCIWLHINVCAISFSRPFCHQCNQDGSLFTLGIISVGNSSPYAW